jgi:hypothetical protein
MALTDTFATVRTSLAARRAERVEARRLRRELAAYTSTADMAELDAMISRAPEVHRAQIDAMVTRLRVA